MPNTIPADLMSLLFAWEAGELSEGQLVQVTLLPRVTLRAMRLDLIERGLFLANRTPDEITLWRAGLAMPASSTGAESTTAPPSGSSPGDAPEAEASRSASETPADTRERSAAPRRK